MSARPKKSPSVVVLMPWMHRDYRDACMATCKLDVTEIDNSVVNRGCTASWNVGLKMAVDTGADWCVWMSAACRFGPEGGLDLIAALGRNPKAHVVETQARGHLIAVNTRVTREIGYCDENFFPSYFQDTDWHRRVTLAFGESLDWRRVEVGVQSESVSHSVQLSGLHVDFLALETYYRRKWGTFPGGLYRTPFNDPERPLTWWPEPGHPMAIGRPPEGRCIAP